MPQISEWYIERIEASYNNKFEEHNVRCKVTQDADDIIVELTTEKGASINWNTPAILKAFWAVIATNMKMGFFKCYYLATINERLYVKYLTPSDKGYASVESSSDKPQTAKEETEAYLCGILALDGFYEITTGSETVTQNSLKTANQETLTTLRTSFPEITKKPKQLTIEQLKDLVRIVGHSPYPLPNMSEKPGSHKAPRMTYRIPKRFLPVNLFFERQARRFLEHYSLRFGASSPFEISDKELRAHLQSQDTDTEIIVPVKKDQGSMLYYIIYNMKGRDGPQIIAADDIPLTMLGSWLRNKQVFLSSNLPLIKHFMDKLALAFSSEAAALSFETTEDEMITLIWRSPDRSNSLNGHRYGGRRPTFQNCISSETAEDPSRWIVQAMTHVKMINSYPWKTRRPGAPETLIDNPLLNNSMLGMLAEYYRRGNCSIIGSYQGEFVLVDAYFDMIGLGPQIAGLTQEKMAQKIKEFRERMGKADIEALPPALSEETLNIFPFMSRTEFEKQKVSSMSSSSSASSASSSSSSSTSSSSSDHIQILQNKQTQRDSLKEKIKQQLSKIAKVKEKIVRLQVKAETDGGTELEKRIERLRKNLKNYRDTLKITRATSKALKAEIAQLSTTSSSSTFESSSSSASSIRPSISTSTSVIQQLQAELETLNKWLLSQKEAAEKAKKWLSSSLEGGDEDTFAALQDAVNAPTKTAAAIAALEKRIAAHVASSSASTAASSSSTRVSTTPSIKSLPMPFIPFYGKLTSPPQTPSTLESLGAAAPTYIFQASDENRATLEFQTKIKHKQLGEQPAIVFFLRTSSHYLERGIVVHGFRIVGSNVEKWEPVFYALNKDQQWEATQDTTGFPSLKGKLSEQTMRTFLTLLYEALKATNIAKEEHIFFLLPNQALSPLPTLQEYVSVFSSQIIGYGSSLM